MAESCAPLPPAGGYECHFVDPVPDSLSCAVCLLPFRDPHLVSCCGKKYCAPCIGRVKAADQPCPVCKQDFVSLLDRDYQRRVLNLKVVCSKKSDGCQWVDELRHLDHHEREECEWAEVECSYQCGAHLPRRLMAKHKREACPQRPMDVKLEWFMKSMETKLTTERERHEREMAAVREEFRNTLTEERETHQKEVEELKLLLAEQKKEPGTESKMAEQKKETESKMAEQKKETESKMTEQKKQTESKMAEQKKETESKMTEQKKQTESKMAEQKKETESKMAEQKKETESKMAEQKKETESKMAEQKREMESKMSEQKREMKDEYTSQIAEMEKSLLEVKKIEEVMKGILVCSPVPSIEFIMTHYSTQNNDDWYSPPFYTGLGGYKMSVRVQANGWGRGAGTHVGMTMLLMRGEYDSRLVWPFRGDITIQLVNHENYQDHNEQTVHFNDTAVAVGEVSDRVTSRERAEYGWGDDLFISHTTVGSSTKIRRFIVDDCLTFRITKIVVHSV